MRVGLNVFRLETIFPANVPGDTSARCRSGGNFPKKWHSQVVVVQDGSLFADLCRCDQKGETRSPVSSTLHFGEDFLVERFAIRFTRDELEEQPSGS